MSDLPLLQVVASSDGYKLGFGDGVVSAVLDGPATRQRKGYSNSAQMASVTWVLGPYDYAYFQAFWRTTLARGVLPFQIDILGDSALPTRHSALLVPGSLKLSEIVGIQYVVTAQVELTRAPAVLDLGEMFGVLERLVNITMPEHIG